MLRHTRESLARMNDRDFDDAIRDLETDVTYGDDEARDLLAYVDTVIDARGVYEIDCPLTFAHTRAFCGNRACRVS